MKLSLTNSIEKIKKRRNEKKGQYHLTCMSSVETEDLDNDM